MRLGDSIGPSRREQPRVADLTVGGLWAGGARDTWLAGDACADPATCGVSDTSNDTVVVRHWDGKAWRAVTPPRAYINSPLDQGAGPVAATSASNAWIFAGRGTESVDYTDALHWTGKGGRCPRTTSGWAVRWATGDVFTNDAIPSSKTARKQP